VSTTPPTNKSFWRDHQATAVLIAAVITGIFTLIADRFGGNVINFNGSPTQPPPTSTSQPCSSGPPPPPSTSPPPIATPAGTVRRITGRTSEKRFAFLFIKKTSSDPTIRQVQLDVTVWDPPSE